MSSSFGKNIKVTIFGQSHSEAIGVVIDGLPAGESISFADVEHFLERRAPGKNAYSTSRREPDVPRVLSGLAGGKTCGAPLCAVIENTDVKSSDYAPFADTPRPSHADYPAYVKYKGFADARGGGHFSGRLTAPLCFAGAVCLQLLSRRGISVGAHISRLAGIDDRMFDPLNPTAELADLRQREFPVIDENTGQKMVESIIAAKNEGDSVGGIIECCALGLPVGVGDPMFFGLENALSLAIFGIPAVRGIEFGTGFAAADMRGSEHNDPYCIEDGNVKTTANNSGGVIGGITNGMPLLFRVAIKPTASIGMEQDTISLSSMQEVKLSIKGRHDPCIVPRAVPCVEAACAVVLLDLLMSRHKI